MCQLLLGMIPWRMRQVFETLELPEDSEEMKAELARRWGLLLAIGEGNDCSDFRKERAHYE